MRICKIPFIHKAILDPIRFGSLLHSIWFFALKIHSKLSHNDKKKPEKLCSQTFTLFRLIKTAMPVKIFRYSFRVPVLQWFLQFPVRVFTFLSFILWKSEYLCKVGRKRSYISLRKAWRVVWSVHRREKDIKVGTFSQRGGFWLFISVLN